MSAAFRPFGVGDLIVLRTQLDHYAPGEIAHVENVMAQEQRARHHRSLQQMQSTFEQETEREEEHRRDLESTERFELESEIQREAKSEEKIAAGLEVSGGFGPVQISAYARYDRTTSADESARTAQNYAKEITEKAIESVRERVRETRTQSELRETEEKNKHEFDNESDSHFSGIYRWVDKYYRVKPVNYGRRLFYEVAIPEPALFLLYARTWTLEHKELPVSPAPPSVPTATLPGVIPGTFLRFWTDAQHRPRFDDPGPLTPEQIHEGNYATLVAAYGAEGVKPVPAAQTVVSYKLAKEFDPAADWTLADEIAIPDKYEARSCQVKIVVKSWESHGHAPDGVLVLTPYPAGWPGYARIQIGCNSATQWGHTQFLGAPFGDHEVLTFALNSERRSLALSAAGNRVGALAMNVEVECERTPEAMSEWQLATYQAIMTAYDKRLLEYNDKVAALRVSAGVKISGDNPEKNLAVIKAELKRQFLKLWMGGDIDLDPAVRDGAGSTLPALITASALANSPKISFVEESFDWENLGFQLLPYFHGRHTRWVELATYTDPDPVFENFMKAGAALVRVPVKPQYTHAVLYYQLTGSIWSRFAGDVPALADASSDPELVELYNSYLVDVNPAEEDTDIHRITAIAPDDPEAFLVKVPTSLVWLQPGSELNSGTP